MDVFVPALELGSGRWSHNTAHITRPNPLLPLQWPPRHYPEIWLGLSNDIYKLRQPLIGEARYIDKYRHLSLRL